MRVLSKSRFWQQSRFPLIIGGGVALLTFGLWYLLLMYPPHLLANTALGMGLAMAALLTWSLSLAQQSQRQRQEAERKNQELAARMSDRQQNEAVLRSFYDSAPMLMGIIELVDNDILHISDNSLSEQWFELSPETMKGKRASELGVPAVHIQEWVQHYREAERTQTPVTFEYSYQTNRGQRWLSATVSPIPSDERPRFSYIIEDITERRQMHQELRESENRWQFALEGSGDGVWDWNAQTNEVFFSRRWKEMLGYGEHEVGNTLAEWDRRVHPDDKDQVYAEIERHFRGETPIYISEHRVLAKDGTYRWILDRGQVMSRDAEGRPLRVIGTHSDISDRKRVEDALRWQEALLRSMANASPLAFLVVDNRTDEILYFNHRFCQIWGIEHLEPQMLRGELKNKDMIPDCCRVLVDVPAFARSCEPLQDESNRVVIEDEIPLVGDHTIRRFSAQIRDEEDRYFGRLYIFEDITERKRAEAEQLRLSQRSQLFSDISLRIRQSLRLATILQTTVTEVQAFLKADRVLLFRTWFDGSGRVVQEAVVPGIQPTLGREFLDPCFQTGYLEQYRQGRVAAITNIDETATEPCYVEFLNNLSVKANLVVPILIRDELWGLLIAHQSQPRQWTLFETELLQQLANQVGIAIAQSQLVESLSESEARFRTIADSAPVLLWLTDTHGHCTFVNQSWLHYTGRTLEQEVGEGWLSSLYPEDQTPIRNEFLAAFASHTDFETEYRLRRADGEYRWMLSKGVPRFTLEGNFEGYIGLCVDISDRREIERLKDEFVSMVSHELRTPLTSISGALKLLASGVLQTQPERGQQMLSIAVNNTDRLVRLINDILDIERIESGKVTMTRQLCDAGTLMIQATESIQDMAIQAGITLRVSPLSASLYADPDRIIQTFTNLLSNAIKFSSPGCVVNLTADQVDSNLPPLHTPPPPSLLPPVPYILFKVADYGRGIPTDKLSSIFERFQQVDASDSRKKGGTGLGLAICRSIVLHHDGQIWAESAIGQGSTFYIALPLAQPNSTHTLPPGTAPLVLVCDDDTSVRHVVRTMLEQQGYRVFAVASGKEAVTQAIELQPSAILLNLMMPEMHGWETLEHIKQHPETTEIPVIILSGLMPDAHQPQPSGITDWIVKPPTDKRLMQSLARALATHHTPVAVLIVEDDPDLAQILRTLFERHGIQTRHATTGTEAIQLSQTLLPNLLVLDLGLPEVDGFAVVDWLRRHNRLRHVPLVVYTARDLDAAERDRLKLGQTLFLTKGRIPPEEVEHRVIDLLTHILPHPKNTDI